MPETGTSLNPEPTAGEGATGLLATKGGAGENASTSVFIILWLGPEP